MEDVEQPDLRDRAIFGGVDLEARRVFLHGEMFTDSDGWDVRTVSRAIMYMDRTPSKIEVWINSPGGDLCEALALYDVIRAVDSPVLTVAFGQVFSAATVVLVAGDQRMAMPQSRFMFHAPMTQRGGHSSILESGAANLKKVEDQMCSVMAKHTRRAKSYWKKLAASASDHYFGAHEMRRLGIVDAVYQHPRRKAPWEGR